MWSSALIHKMHILIFLIAVSHVLFGMASLTLSWVSMVRWRVFEEKAQGGELLTLPTDQLQREGESKVIFGIRQCVRQFTDRIDLPTYIALRQEFLFRTRVFSPYISMRTTTHQFL
jgi:hypothetical protein